ncbi:MAG: hypothetical protein ACM3SV_15175 [Betaproteobacteria bacterium]
MKSKSLLAACLTVASLLSLPALAQPAPAAGAGGPGMSTASNMPGSGRGMRNCTQAADPTACQAHREARQKAFAACKEKPAAERRQCMQDQRMNNIDCGKAKNSERCEARKKAATECKGKTGSEFHQCVRDKLPPPDCSKARNPERCAAMQKAREACQGKTGTELRQCVASQKQTK